MRAGKQRRSTKKAAVGTRTKERIAKPGKAAGIIVDALAPSPFALWAQQRIPRIKLAAVRLPTEFAPGHDVKFARDRRFSATH